MQLLEILIPDGYWLFIEMVWLIYSLKILNMKIQFVKMETVSNEKSHDKQCNCNECQNSFYYDGVYKQCMKYCGNGKITNGQECSETNVKCVYGYQLTSNQCYNTNCPNNTNEADIIQCYNCSFVNDDKLSNQNCGSGMYYHELQKKCLVYCQNKIISSDSNYYKISHICIDGYQWDNQQSKCIKASDILCPENSYENYVKQCTNCNLISNNNQQAQNSQGCENSCKTTQNLYFSQQQKKCMYYCQKGIIANDVQSCQTSQICVEGYGQCNSQGQVNQNPSTNGYVQTGQLF